ncbi:hypothetical protein MK805_01920 [Shimazuella sp. AN120528]|uniref:hypothetical protein n=1 Tax=Shimazuella soli TaxID=1892854 RepID=UPI001F0DA3B4|nr:hypothetical protein [Shimazuella soli]MCH5583726.1 hypothetical protein [Shimazuella soli]
MKRKTDPVQFVWVQNQHENHSAELKESLEAKKRVIQVLMEMALTEQQEKPIHLLG